MLKYEIKSDSLSSMTGYDMDLEDVEIELARDTVQHNLEPYVVILGNVDKADQESTDRLNQRAAEDQQEALLQKTRKSSRSALSTLENKSSKAGSRSTKVNFSDINDSPKSHKKKETDSNTQIEREGLTKNKSQEQWHSQQSKSNTSKNDDQDSEVLPMFGAMFIASCLGGPVCVLAGMKLGMFAAVGGGIMGYTTGKMFAESGERQTMVKGEHVEEEGNVKKKKIMKRINEWERFEANCSKIRELETEIDSLHPETETREQINQILDRMKSKSVKRPRTPRRPYSIGSSPKELSQQTSGQSVSILPELENNMSLDDKILLWRTSGGICMRRNRKRANSLPALVEETEEEDSVSIKNKRRSKSIDSYVLS